MGYRDFFANGRMWREITYGNGQSQIVPLGGGGISRPGVGQNMAETLYGRTPQPFLNPAEPEAFPTTGGPRYPYGFKPTSASGGQGMARLPINQIPGSGQVFQMGGYVPGTSLVPVNRGALVPTGQILNTTPRFDPFLSSPDVPLNSRFASPASMGASNSPFQTVPTGGIQGNLFNQGGGYVQTGPTELPPMRLAGSGQTIYGTASGLTVKEPFGVRLDRYANTAKSLLQTGSGTLGANIATGGYLLGQTFSRPSTDIQAFATAAIGYSFLRQGINKGISTTLGTAADFGLMGLGRGTPQAGGKGFVINSATGSRVNFKLPGIAKAAPAIFGAIDAYNFGSTDPATAQRGFAGLSGLGGFYGGLGLAAATGVGTIPALALGVGGSLLAGGFAGGLRNPLAEEAYNANTKFREDFSTITKSLPQQNVLLQNRFNQDLNFIQKIINPAIQLSDLVLGGASPFITQTPQFFGIQTKAGVTQGYEELKSYAGGGSGPFQGLGVGQRYGILATQLFQRPNNQDLGKTFGDVVNRYGGLPAELEKVRDNALSTIRDETKGMPYKQAAFKQLLTQYEVDQAIKEAATRSMQQEKILLDIDKRQLTAPTIPYEKTDREKDIERSASLFSRKVKAGGGYHYEADPKKVQSLSASLSKIPARLKADNRSDLETFFVEKSKEARRNIEEFGTNIYNSFAGGVNTVANTYKGIRGPAQIAAREGEIQKFSNIAQGAANRQAIATLGQAAFGGGGGGGYSRGPSAYQRMAMARWAQQDTEKAYEARGRYLSATFERRFDAIEFPTLDRPQMNYFGYNANLPGAGTVNAAEFMTAARDAYQSNIVKDLSEQREKAYEQAKPAIEALTGLRKEQYDAFQKDLKSAPSPTARMNVAANYERSLGDSDKAIRSLVKNLKQFDMVLEKVSDSKFFEPFLQDSLSQYTKSTFGSIKGDIRAVDQERRSLLRNDIMQRKYQLNQERQLGLVNTSRFLEKDFALENEDLNYQQEDFNAFLLLRRQSVDIYRDLAANASDPNKRAEYTRLADQLSAGTDRLATAGQASIDKTKANFTPERLQFMKDLVGRQEVSKSLAPFTNAIVSGAFGGNFGQQFGTATKNAFAGLANSQLSGALYSLAGRVPGLQNILTGGLNQLPQNLANFAQMRVAPGGIGPVASTGMPAFTTRAMAQYGDPAIAGKALTYGTVGTLASQFVLNQIPYANRKLSSFGNLAGGIAGGLIGGPIGAGIGSFAGGMLGALPFAQNPIGGAATGAISGAAAGAMFGPIGMGIGALAGGLFGFLGGRESKQQREADREAKRQQERQNRLSGLNFAKSTIGLGVDYARDLFSGYGALAPKQKALQDYLGVGTLNAKAEEQGLSGDVLKYAQSEYKRLGKFFQPVQALSNKYASVLNRPGGFEGALYDQSLNSQLSVNRAGPYSGQALGQLTNTFESLRSNLGQYGFDTKRADLAYNVFSSQYQNQLQDLDYNIDVAGRNVRDTNEQIGISRSSRGIQRDVLSRQLSKYDETSQQQIESAMGTLQRRENRAAVVTRLKEDQAFQKDILTRQFDIFERSNQLQGRQETYQQLDAVKNLDDLIQSRKVLVEGFGDMASRLTDASQEFYQLSEAVKEVTRALEVLSRNLR